MGSQNCASLRFMRVTRKNVWWSRVAIPVWLSVWMLAVPLFHVHPEADHHHGEAGHVHGGTVHTIFSPDLDGEFDSHQHTTDVSGHTAPSHVALSGHPPHALETAEIGYSFLSDSTDRKFPKPLFVHVLVVESIAIIACASTPSIAQHRASTPLHTFLTRDIPSRAPPFLLV